MSTPTAGILPDTAKLSADAEHIRAELVLIAARDAANVLMKHANSLRDMSATEWEIFDGTAKTFRALERSAADKAGVAAE